LPGSYVRHTDGECRPGRYWRIAYREHERAGLAELETEFRARLDAGVRRAVDGVSAGCFLSGGTDSSAVAGLLGTATGRPARSYSIGFDAPGYDEMGYARLAARHFGAKLREYYVTADDVVELLPRIAEAYGQPFGNESVIPAYFCARVAREEGVERMLAGDGGDELFAGNVRYAKQELFERYGRIPGWMRRALIEPLFLGLPGGDRLPLLRKVRNYIRQANVPMPHRAESYNYLERMGPSNVFTPEFLTRIDTEAPLALLAEAYDDAQAGTMLNRFLALDLRFTLADNDLPKVSRMCDLAGVEVAYPILDDELIDFAARLPAALKMKGRQLRWFWKHALRDFLPQEVLNKPKHGFGLPYGVWLVEHEGLQRITRDSLGGLRRRGIVQERFIDEVERLHREEHAVYYGAMIWTLVQLEQWFRFHVDRAG
jgi:asparagine synthase (glutamine-hydrolysing)